MGLNPQPAVTRFLVEGGVFRDEPFSLVDVGASGGIQEHWRRFGGSLQAVGFDQLTGEVERLNGTERNPRVHYVAARVGCREMAVGRPNSPFNTDPLLRTSSVRAWELLKCNFTNTYYDQTSQGTVAAGLIELDEFIAQGAGNVDFVKVDTDGDDLAVLLGAGKLLSGAGPIGLAVETPFVGETGPQGNTFSSIDTYLQKLGYSMFIIEPRCHTRAALPKPFRWHQPADTHAGQARWADTLFFRDVCAPGYEEHFQVTLTPRKLLKLCCAFELFSLEDCAAEILVAFRDRLQAVVDVDQCLDLLTPPLPDGRTVPYGEYIDFFEKNVEAFYSGAGTPVDAKAAEERNRDGLQIAELREQLARQELREQAQLQQWKVQLESSELECARLREAIESSLALKLARSLPHLSAPLRALFLKLAPGLKH